MLSGAFFGSEVTHMYEDLERPQNIGHLFGVLPVALFEDVEVYRSRMDKAIDEIRQARRAPGVERIYLPGDASICGLPSGGRTASQSAKAF